MSKRDNFFSVVASISTLVLIICGIWVIINQSIRINTLEEEVSRLNCVVIEMHDKYDKAVISFTDDVNEIIDRISVLEKERK